MVKKSLSTFSFRHPQRIDGSSIENEILLDLPRKECDAVLAALEPVELRSQQVLIEMGRPIQFAYFINSGLASVLSVLSEGKTVEVGLIGKEGFVGLPLAVGWITSATRVVMQVGGDGFRLAPGKLMEVMRHCPRLQQSLNRYAQALALQGTQMAACNRLHTVEERLARWLLMSQDRLTDNYVPLTQESLANMLGTRRASVTVSAGVLEQAGLIACARGSVKILNRPRLEEAACECYETIKRQSKLWEKESH